MQPEVTTFYLLLSAALFALGAAGVLIRRNTLVMLICVELMLNAVNLSLVALSQHFGVNDAQVYVFFVLAVAAAEAAAGLAIIISLFRNFVTVQSTEVYGLKG